MVIQMKEDGPLSIQTDHVLIIFETIIIIYYIFLFTFIKFDP